MERNKLKSIQNQIFPEKQNTDKKYMFDLSVFSFYRPTHRHLVSDREIKQFKNSALK